MRSLLGLCPLFLALLFGAAPALAGKRVALVLANSSYQYAPSLANPVNDGAVMAKTLKDAGFEIVESRHDLSALETRRVLRDFADVTRDADIAVIYYAGHGIEIDGINYIVPVDAALERDLDAFDEAFPLERILDEAGNGLARDRPRSGKGGAVQPEHAGCLCLQGRFDRPGRR